MEDSIYDLSLVFYFRHGYLILYSWTFMCPFFRLVDLHVPNFFSHSSCLKFGRDMTWIVEFQIFDGMDDISFLLSSCVEDLASDVILWCGRSSKWGWCIRDSWSWVHEKKPTNITKFDQAQHVNWIVQCKLHASGSGRNFSSSRNFSFCYFERKKFQT